jgi:flagellar motor switch/type III secretory pathway protein FliN
MALGRELGARWIGALPGFHPGPKAEDVWVQAAEDAPPLPGSAWPLLRLSLLLPGKTERRLEILLPLGALEGAAAVAPSGGTKGSERLGNTPVTLFALLGSVRLRLKELYDLRPGDCVMLESGPQDEAVVLMSHQPVFRARPGRNGRHLAIQMLGPLERPIGDGHE